MLLEKNGPAEWWTFAGARANATLAGALSLALECPTSYDSFTVTCEAYASRHMLIRALGTLPQAQEGNTVSVEVEEQAIKGLKFSACLPRNLALDMLRARLCDPPAVQYILAQTQRISDVE